MRPLFLCFFLTFFSGGVWGDDKEDTFEKRMLRTSDRVGATVDQAAEWIDLKLAGGKEYVKQENKSSAKVTQLVTYSEGGKTKTSTDFSINLRLPNLERRWQVRFTSYDELEENRNLEQRKFRTTPPKREYGAGLAFFRKLGKVRVSFQPRLVLKDPLEMRYTLRFESTAKQKEVHLAPRVEFFADPKKGTGEFASLELVIGLTPKFELSFQNDEEYRERGNSFSTGHGVTLDYSISENRAIGIAASCSSNNRPEFHLDSYRVGIPYGQEVYRDKMRYSLTPFLSFAKSKHFKGDAGATFLLALIF